MRLHDRRARGHAVFSRREEDRQKPLDDQVVNFGFRFAQFFWHLQRGNNRKVIRHFFVVENTLIRFDPAVLGDGRGVRRDTTRNALTFRQTGHGIFDRIQVVFRQEARVRSWIGQCLVTLIQTLRQRQGRFGRKTKTSVGFALQRGQIKQSGWRLGFRLGHFGDFAWLGATGRNDAFSSGL